MTGHDFATFDLPPDLPPDLLALAVRAVVRNALDVGDLAELLAMLGLTDV